MKQFNLNIQKAEYLKKPIIPFTAEVMCRHHKWCLQIPTAVNGMIAFSYYTKEPKFELAGITVRKQSFAYTNGNSSRLKFWQGY